MVGSEFYQTLLIITWYPLGSIFLRLSYWSHPPLVGIVRRHRHLLYCSNDKGRIKKSLHPATSKNS